MEKWTLLFWCKKMEHEIETGEVKWSMHRVYNNWGPSIRVLTLSIIVIGVRLMETDDFGLESVTGRGFQCRVFDLALRNET